MAKEGLDRSSVKAFLGDAARRTGWALCIGAGTSLPAFPSWHTLVTRLVARDVAPDLASQIATNLLSQFSPDAVIQAACDRLGLAEVDFAQLLSTELYRDVLEGLSAEEQDLLLQGFSAYRPAHLNVSTWRQFLAVAEERVGRTTAWSLAQVLSIVVGTELAPAAILSFNAEPLLFALTTAMLVVRGRTRQHIDLVNRTIAVRQVQRIPYIFCHGLLPIAGSTVARSHMAATDKLVFSEAAYLELANLSFSWQSSAFLDVCASRRTVFVGVSLSDPNMRRWLGWLHASRTEELADTRGYDGPSTHHIWIRKDPPTAEERRWVEASVAHLGVRLAWITDWHEVADTLSRMLGVVIDPPTP